MRWDEEKGFSSHSSVFILRKREHEVNLLLSLLFLMLIEFIFSVFALCSGYLMSFQLLLLFFTPSSHLCYCNHENKHSVAMSFAALNEGSSF